MGVLLLLILVVLDHVAGLSPVHLVGVAGATTSLSTCKAALEVRSILSGTLKLSEDRFFLALAWGSEDVIFLRRANLALSASS